MSRSHQLFNQTDSFFGITWDFISRVITTIFSGAFYFLVAKESQIENFASFQLAGVVSAILIWIGDLGLGSLLINLLASRKTKQFQIAWTIRFMFTFLLLSFTSIVIAYFIPKIDYLLIFVIGVDLYVDSNYNIRILQSRKIFRYFLQPTRKMFQLLIYIVLIKNFNLFFQINICYALLFPSLMMILFDLHKLGGLTFGKLESNLNLMALNSWIQGASSYITLTDTIVLKYFGHNSLIVYLGFPRKFTQSLSIMSSVTAPRNQHSVASQGEIRRINIEKIAQTSLLILLGSLGIMFFQRDIFLYTFNVSLSREIGILVSAVLISAPLQSLVVGVNSLLFGISSFKVPSIIANLVSLFYVIILIICLNIGYEVAISLAVLIILKPLVEGALLTLHLYYKLKFKDTNV